MRFAIMLRAWDRPGGIGIYTRNIVDRILAVDRRNDYLLIYNNPLLPGRYAVHPNVEEIYIPPANPLVWDQWMAARALEHWGADLVFHTKFTVPIFVRAKKVMALHGASWYVHPEFYSRRDVFYVRQAMPVYCRAADFLVSNSALTTEDYIRKLHVPSGKIATIHLAAGEGFRRIEDADALERVRRRYDLPERFLLTVTCYEYRKNVSSLLRAFASVRSRERIDLVIVGKNCDLFARDFGLEGRGLIGAVHFPGWIEQDDLPSLYNLAAAFVFPSIYEEFGIPVVEAMACGCPVVAASTGAIPELTGDAALLCPPFDGEGLERNILAVLGSEEVAGRMRRRGIERARGFSWEKAARETIEVLERTADGGR